ncbi:general transcription factor 3C polypeptide 2-like [Diachasmimorpha longicaudata]|uniref:general transcription factor 3C polypeptide 2-like n=1 Tax=Diachasmimorpha longicaudata TaxID=58733 RepID=UPI0030B906EF
MFNRQSDLVHLLPAVSQEGTEEARKDLQKKKKDIKNIVNPRSSRVKRKAAEIAAKRILNTANLAEASTPLQKKKKIAVKVKDCTGGPPVRKTVRSRLKTLWIEGLNLNEKALCGRSPCDFSSPTFEDICEHHSTCTLASRSKFICRFCQWSCEKKDEIVGHMKKAHSREGNENNCNYTNEMKMEEMGVKKRGRNGRSGWRSSPGSKATFLRNSMHIKTSPNDMTFGPALQWTIQFQTKYYRLRLFEELQVNDFEDVEAAEEYLPGLKVSMATTVLGPAEEQVRDDDWRRWNRFEADVVGGVPTLFTGGPIWGLAWMPIPSTMHNVEPEQFVAVSTHKGMEDYFEVGRSYCGKNSIQIWNLGVLGHNSAQLRTPELCYVVGHEGGTIWCLEWCPSGGYEHDGERMGLLAAAMSSGVVHIYSMPFPGVMGRGKVFRMNPVMVLHVHDRSGTASQCMTLTWSKTSNHDTIATGFADGYVALWNLTTKSPLLRTEESSIIHLQPFMHFFAHHHAVMFVTVVPLKETRYLVTAGMDRYAKIWDLEDTRLPFWIFKKGVAVNGTWMTHWPTIFTSYDDVLGMSRTMTYIASVRESASRFVSVLGTNSPVYAIASSDWANGICQGTAAGEVVACFPPQLLYTKEMSRIMDTRWLVSNIEVVDFQKKIVDEGKKKEYEYRPETYEECQEKFGVAFRDDLDNTRNTRVSRNQRKVGLTPNTMKKVAVEQYPFAAINRISWNPNSWSYLWIAVGYRNGFIRILNLKKMNETSISSDLLSTHAAATTNKDRMRQKADRTRDRDRGRKRRALNPSAFSTLDHTTVIKGTHLSG